MYSRRANRYTGTSAVARRTWMIPFRREDVLRETSELLGQVCRTRPESGVHVAE
jgi:hypothetical protein